MIRFPKRQSLVVETASILRDGIADGTWKRALPGERILCEKLRVSRPTLRAALKLLEKEGIVGVSHGKPRTLHPGKIIQSNPNPKVIGIIVNQPVTQFSQMTLNLIMEMRHHLQVGGFNSELFFADLPKGSTFKHLTQKLENFISTEEISCCILVLSSEEQQVWFSNHKTPALVLGSTYPSAKLPCLDVDYFAACRHAAGILLGRGHRNLVFVRNDNRVAGDRASADGFLDGLEKSAISDAKGTIVRYDGNARSLASQLDPLLDSVEDRPTGIITCRPHETIIMVMHLLKRGLSIPDDISIIARDWEYTFECMTPKLAHYVAPKDFFAKRLVLLMLQLLDNGSLPVRKNLILSEFREGSSIKRLNNEG